MKAKFRLAAVLLALLMVLSASSVLLVACNNNSEPTTPPSAGTTGPGSLVTAQSLVDSGKLKVMYPFEDSGRGRTAAVDPYTGETLSSNRGEYIDATLVDNPDAETASQSAKALSVRESGFNVGKLSAEQMPSADGGLSVSFWAYNDGTDATQSDETAGTLAFDFMNVVTNGTTTVTWGNIRSAGSDFYPGLEGTQSTITVGRGAYSDAIYPRAQANRSQTSLSRYAMNYTGYNAIAGNAQTKDARESVTSLAEEMEGKWRYVTIVFDKEVGISFYANGRLAYCYSSQLFTGAATGGDWDTVYTNFVSGAMEDEDNYELSMFNDTLYGEAEVYVDDVIVGLALTAAECEALYEGLSGTDVDASLTSTMSEEDAAEADAITAEIDKRKAELPVEGDSYGPDAIGAAVGGADLNGDGKIDDVVGDAKKAFVEQFNKLSSEEKTAKYLDVIGSVGCDTDGASLGQGGFYKPAIGEDGTFEMTVSGIQLASGVNNFNATYVTLYSGPEQKASVRVDWSASDNLKGFEWDTDRLNVVGDGGGIDGDLWWKDSAEASNGLYLNVVQRYCLLDIVFAYDGEDLTITYNIYYHFVGDTFEADGKTYTIPKDDTTLFNTVTYTIGATNGLAIDEVFDMSSLSIRFGSEDSAFLIERAQSAESSDAAESAAGDAAEEPAAPALSNKVAGGERLDSVPAAGTVFAAPQGEYTYKNAWHTYDTHAYIELPEGEYTVSYEADVYTTGSETYYGTGISLVATDEESISGNQGTNASVIYVALNPAGDLLGKDFANLKDENAFSSRAVQKPISSAFEYTFGEALYKKDVGTGYIYSVQALHMICTITLRGDNYLFTYYRDSVDEDNIIARYAVTFKNTKENLFLTIGGDAVYMENIKVSGFGEAQLQRNDGAAATTSGSKTKTDTEGYTAIAAA